MDKCPKCGAGEDASEGAFSCGTRRGVNGTVKVSGRCLRRQLAAANEKLAESARLATESAQLADGLAKDLAAANERAGRLEAALEWYANPNWEPQRGPDGEPCGCPAWEDNGAIARKALEVPDAL